MSTVAPANEVWSRPGTQPSARVVSGLEVLLVYAGVLLYIWRWQFSHPRLWVVLLAIMVLSHLARGERPRDLGLTFAGLRANAEKILPLVLALYLPLVFYGFARHLLVLLVPGKQSLVWFAAYLSWCAIQQYVAQSYFHRRLMSVIENPHRRSLVVGLMFGATHIPNPILMVVTTLAGFVFAEVFARHRNIWPLALAQAAGGFLIAAISPPSLIRNMRVGPGYYFYRLKH
jgi:membrane protease YdiL (CAAX protease family)